MTKEECIEELLRRGYYVDCENGVIYKPNGEIANSIGPSKEKYIYIFKKHLRQDYIIFYLTYGYMPTMIKKRDGDKQNLKPSNLIGKANVLNYNNNGIGIDIGEKKLLKKIKYNLKMNSGWSYFNDRHMKDEIIHNVYLKVLDQINQGKISNVYEDIQGYIFITCRNEFVKYNRRHQDNTVDKNHCITEMTWMDFKDTDTYTEPLQELSNIIYNHLLDYDPFWASLFQAKCKGISRKDIVKYIFNGRHSYQNEMSKLTQYLKVKFGEYYKENIL